MLLLITYDLHQPDRDYPDVISQIKSFGSWAHDEESVWLVDTAMSPSECRDSLNMVTKDATYFVARLQGGWAAQGLSDDVVRWLRSPSRNW